LIVHGRDRPEALARLKRALSELIVDGIDTTVPLFHALLEEEDIRAGNYSIHWLEKWLARTFGQ
ncbi:MAG: acetyl-CoA carboxylase biotin carboxylase subunit, partial [Rhodobacteraceae bacterium]|nr:acetyl-CoA carboxylase biotin carboxylase subunit [Paracoccaceae bacterium]